MFPNAQPACAALFLRVDLASRPSTFQPNALWHTAL
jgi:hypothetical protein